MVILENININIAIDMDFLENIDIDRGILRNIDIDKILYRLEFGISNRAIRWTGTDDRENCAALTFCAAILPEIWTGILRD